MNLIYILLLFYLNIFININMILMFINIILIKMSTPEVHINISKINSDSFLLFNIHSFKITKIITVIVCCVRFKLFHLYKMINVMHIFIIVCVCVCIYIYMICLVFLFILKCYNFRSHYSSLQYHIYYLLFKCVRLITNIEFYSNSQCIGDYTYVTLDYKTSLKSLGYICSNSQKFIVWVKIIVFFFFYH